MVRLAILLVLLLLSIWEWVGGTRKYVYWLALTGLFAFFSLRYGQGTDYITYMSIYANVAPLHTFPSFSSFAYNTVEIGFFYLMSFFRMLGVHYILFVAILTAFGLFCLHRFIRRFSPLPMLSLTFYFAVYSLVYMESALRQMIALGIATGWVFVDWTDGKRLRAICGIVLASLLHTSAAVLLLLPILFWRPRSLYIIEWKWQTTAALAVAFVAAAAAFNLVNLSPIIGRLPSGLAYRIMAYYTRDLSLMALANRGVFLAIVLLLAWRSRDALTAPEKLLVNLYILGFAIYIMLMSFDLIASRMNIYFRIVDVCLIPLLFYKNRQLVNRSIVALPILLGLMSFLYVKDISTTMDYAQYYSSNPLHYPYVTVFNTDRILEEKFVNVKNATAMNAYQAGGMSWDEYYDSLQRKPVNRSPLVPY